MNAELCIDRCSARVSTAARLMRLAWTVAFAAAPVLSHEAFAQGAGRSGKDVVEAVCITCHGTGAQGAPKIGDRKAWDKRASQGLTSLTEHALKGIRQMPAHGGSPNLTDLEIARGELVTLTTEHGRSDAGHNAVHLAWRADARGMALDWWIQELEKPAVRAALLD